ncbi:uncharacterized protein LOC100881117 [Megachile rotundata]|uniref:uncharacterized protein LOC100881117 n=1 Tax=Megachile rotundata TaxID=143995 RepID=UPI000258D794|nr:PREDICTED: uncharacterized protein LOC100881117 [Megachile rotundata]
MRAPWLVLILAKILDLMLVLGDTVCHHNDTDFAVPSQRSTEILSRRRRLVFPTGSTFVLTVSILQPIPVKLPNNWNLDFEFDMIWPIPVTREKVAAKRKYFVKRPWTVKRRHRRDLYANLEAAFDSQKLPGRQCVLRTICEANLLLSPPGVSFIEDAIRLILSNVEDVEDVDSYDIAYRSEVPCDVAYACPFSFLKLLLYHLYSDSLS